MVMMIYFTGHEKESDLSEGIYTTEYRLYDARVGRWLSVDPLFEKYVGMSPYNYCMLNPAMMVDVDGREIRVNGEDELKMIQNTLPVENRDFVKFNDNGYIDKNQLNKYKGTDYNTNILKEIVNSDVTMEVFLGDRYTYKDKEGHINESVQMGYYNFDPQFDSESDKDIDGTTINGTSPQKQGSEDNIYQILHLTSLHCCQHCVSV